MGIIGAPYVKVTKEEPEDQNIDEVESSEQEMDVTTKYTITRLKR